MITKEQADAHDADYADEFGQPDKQPHQMSDEEAFGLSEPAPDAAPEGSAAEEAGEAPAEEAAEQAAGEGDAAPGGPVAEAGGEPAAAPADAEQRLKSWEGRLKARQAELDAREAAMGSSSVNEEQGSLPMDEGGEGEGEGGEVDAGGAADAGDPAAVLAEDFGPDFVAQITALIKQIAGDSVGGVSATVDQVIADLQNERLQNHFGKIAETHADFMDVVESPEFATWKAEQPNQEQLQAVIDSGSARQIIDMLTAFKKASAGGDSTASSDTGGYDDEALDAAEGVRSSGLTLPKEPAASDDFAKAWNEA